MIDLLIKYPTRSRPHLFKILLQKYVKMLSGKYKVKFIISMDLDDETCNNNPMRYFLESMKNKIDLEYYYETSKNKIDACNRNIPNDGWKICLLISDDMIPKIHGFDEIIIKDMENHFPNFDGVLNYNCGGKAFPKVMVLSIVGHNYYNKFGYIYHPAYTSLFCDEEQTVLARSMDKLVDIDNKIITHDWNTIKDNLRKHTEKYFKEDQAVFQKRKLEGFPQ